MNVASMNVTRSSRRPLGAALRVLALVFLIGLGPDLVEAFGPSSRSRGFDS